MSGASRSRQQERFISLENDVLTGNLTTLKGKVDIIHAIEASTSNDVATLLVGLARERQSCKALGACWNSAEKCFKSANPETFRQIGVEMELHIALIAYVMETPFYLKFNKTTRELLMSGVESFPYKNYFKLLLLAIIKVKGCPSSLPMDVVVYRGMEGRFKVSEFVFFQNFLSTSRKEKIAQNFAGDKGTVFVISGLMVSGMQAGEMLNMRGNPNSIGLEHIPQVIGQVQEYECLIWPNESFRVTKVDKSRADGILYIYLQA